jgi:ketol-acid reductoisomerase
LLALDSLRERKYPMSELNLQCDELKALQGLKVCILGYGSQGKAHAQNLNDSGVDVVVGLRAGSPSNAKAKAAGLAVASPSEAVKDADMISFLVPDMAQKELFESAVKGNLKAGATLLFAHGLNVHYGWIKDFADHDVVLVAPKAPGDLLRETYTEGRGVPCLYAVEQDKSGQARARTLAYAHALGAGRAGLIETSFKEETETDLFGEQAVLCGGVTALIQTGFETLVEAGYKPEVAYFECLHELKLIVDLIQNRGIPGMRANVSETARFGDVTRGPRVVDEHVKNNMKEVLKEVQSGAFAEEWRKEYEDGCKHYNELLLKGQESPLEVVGQRLRAQMAWLGKQSEKASETSSKSTAIPAKAC